MLNICLDKINQLGEGLKKAFIYNKSMTHDDEYLVVNVTNKKLLINNDIYEFNDFVDCTIQTSKETNPYISLANAFVEEKSNSTNSIIKRSLVGGIIGGAPGAIIGGVTAGRDTSSSTHIDPTYTDYTLILATKNMLKPTITLNVGSNENNVNEIVNLFKIILSTNKDNNVEASPQINTTEYISNLYEQAHAVKSSINVAYKELFMNEDKIHNAYDLYLQILINDTSSKEARFYFSFFETLKFRGDKYAHKFDSLFNQYKNDLKDYLLCLNEDNLNIDTIVHDTIIYAKGLGGGYINELSLEYHLLFDVGDMIQELFGEKYLKQSVVLWKKAISIHHQNRGQYNEKFNVSDYVSKILLFDSNYTEPKNGSSVFSSLFAGWTSESCGGCLVGIGILGFILYLLFS